MPSPKKSSTPVATPPRPAAAANDRRPKQAPSMSHERIASDIAAFRRAGGKVEVLGNTPVLRSVGPAGVSKAADSADAKSSTAARRAR